MAPILDDVEPLADGSVREWWILPDGDVRIITKKDGMKVSEKTIETEREKP